MLLKLINMGCLKEIVFIESSSNDGCQIIEDFLN